MLLQALVLLGRWFAIATITPPIIIGITYYMEQMRRMCEMPSVMEREDHAMDYATEVIY
jgi:hypothetical protein